MFNERERDDGGGIGGGKAVLSDMIKRVFMGRVVQQDTTFLTAKGQSRTEGTRKPSKTQFKKAPLSAGLSDCYPIISPSQSLSVVLCLLFTLSGSPSLPPSSPISVSEEFFFSISSQPTCSASLCRALRGDRN